MVGLSIGIDIAGRAGKGPSRIVLDQVAPISASEVATFGAAVAAAALEAFFHRFVANAAADDPAGFALLAQHIQTTDPVFQASQAVADGGETGITGPTLGSDRVCAVSYRGALGFGTPVKVTGGANTTLQIPALTLVDPGRSWVLGFGWNATAGTPTGTDAPEWRCGSGVSGYLNVVDSGEPVTSWPGYTIGLQNSSVWAGFAVEVFSA